jgi:hypothetical protein
MPTTSTVPAFETALFTALKARVGLADVQVLEYWPGPATEDEGIYLGDWDTGDAAAFEMTPRSVKQGRQPRDERAEIPLTIQAWRPGEAPPDLPDAKARVWALFGHVEDVIADDPEVNNTVAFFDTYRGRCRYVAVGTGWAVRMSVSIVIRSRLT